MLQQVVFITFMHHLMWLLCRFTSSSAHKRLCQFRPILTKKYWPFFTQMLCPHAPTSCKGLSYLDYFCKKKLTSVVQTANKFFLHQPQKIFRKIERIMHQKIHEIIVNYRAVALQVVKFLFVFNENKHKYIPNLNIKKLK